MDASKTTYSIKETADTLNVPQGTIRQWETDFAGVLDVPRDSWNARYYTVSEIERLLHIKTMREKDISKPVIKELLQTWDEWHVEKVFYPDILETEESLQSAQKLFEKLPEVREAIVSDVKRDIRNELKNDLAEEMRKMMASCLREGKAHITEEIKELSEDYQAAISRQEKVLSEQFKSLSEAYKSEVTRRDEALMENINLMSELKTLKDEKERPFYKKWLGK